METILDIIIVLVVILVSMMLHELAHGFVAYKLGDDTAKLDGRLTFNPLKHLDPWMSVVLPLLLLLSGGPVFGGAKPVPVNSMKLKGGAWGMALVAVAGPMTNLVLAFIGCLIGRLAGVLVISEGALFVIPGIVGLSLSYFIMVNLGFAIFNMIPIPPLDGSRIVYAIAPDPIRRGMEKIEQFGIVIVLLLVVGFSGIFNQLMLGGMEGVLTMFGWIIP